MDVPQGAEYVSLDEVVEGQTLPDGGSPISELGPPVQYASVALGMRMKRAVSEIP